MATPIIKIDNFYLKREDHNLTGSVKDRAIELQVKNIKNKGISHAVLSSTGNAAISAAFFCRQYQINLTVFVSPKINPHKLQLICPATIVKSDKAISDAFKFAKANNSFFLRQSTDPVAQDGYSQIGLEINQQLPEITSIFFPVGSGTTLLGAISKLTTTPLVFAVQPASNPTIARYFSDSIPPETDTITDALSVRMIPLKNEIISKLKQSHGRALAVANNDVVQAREYLKQHQISTSPEGALTLAGFFKAQKEGLNTGLYPLIILTGTDRTLHG